MIDTGAIDTGAMNTELLVTDADHFRVAYEINPYMHTDVQPDGRPAAAEHAAIVAAHRGAGRQVRRMRAAPDCPDMVFVANTAVVAGRRAVLGDPPPERKAEIPYVRDELELLGFAVVESPYPFSGQGDALACGDLLLTGEGQRTDPRMPAVLAEVLGFGRDRVVRLRTSGPAFYDLDLAVGVIGPDRVAYHPGALDRPSRTWIRELAERGVDLIEVDAAEAAAFALNLVGDGDTVVMTAGAPRLAAALRERGLGVVTLPTAELAKGGGGIRCTALTLDTAAPGGRP